MDKRIAIAVIVMASLGVVVGGFFVYRNWSKQAANQALPGNISRTENGRKYFSKATIGANSFFFSPDVVEVKAGEEATLNVHSSGDHSFVIDELGINVLIPNGKTETIKFTPSKKGIFKFYCAVPGHREAGMEGTLVVN